MGDIMKRLWNMSQTTKVILCSIFVLVLVIEPNLSLAAPWFTSQKAYGETAVAAQEAAATEGQAATPEATVAEEPVAAEEPAVEEQEPVAVEEGPSAEAPAAEEPATEEQTADEAVEPTPAESPVAVEATSPVTTPHSRGRLDHICDQRTVLQHLDARTGHARTHGRHGCGRQL
jgi:type IV secretory pathway VirB10-like protein